MRQIIEMAKFYNKRPSEILSVEDDYVAYCFDEVCYYYLVEIIDNDGKKNWNKIKWSDKKVEGNKEFIDFVKG